MDGGKSPQELAAVSIYRNIKKEPVLITLHTQDWCCYPLSQGTVYSVNLYKIKKTDSKITLIDITRDLGEESSGLDGENDIGEKLIFKYKNISSIKKCLDKNYKFLYVSC
ncbi:hypothetical protein [Acinetobacter pollinis]|uniref:Uncharacterized protein n=1 Tax=Acinetobacter pollinis TaxID=2605270 RepID=A0ABU6DU09_9GAMM|nr:hypothetical protein [Acinetobacter pollinis]MEB5477122.1 hypothetical protein [Acinetobacter pollinis]